MEFACEPVESEPDCEAIVVGEEPVAVGEDPVVVGEALAEVAVGDGLIMGLGDAVPTVTVPWHCCIVYHST